MYVGDIGGVPASAAGAPLQQREGTEIERRAQAATNARREVQSELKAEQAAGIGQTDEDAEVSDRDADGRRLWELGEHAAQHAPPHAADETPRQSKDPRHESGERLDLTG